MRASNARSSGALEPGLCNASWTGVLTGEGIPGRRGLTGTACCALESLPSIHPTASGIQNPPYSNREQLSSFLWCPHRRMHPVSLMNVLTVVCDFSVPSVCDRKILHAETKPTAKTQAPPSGFAPAADRLESSVQVVFRRAPLVKGNVYEMARKCGKPSCACTRGELHRSMVLSWSQRGKTQLFFDFSRQAC